jgi:hypothetical protein
MSFNMNELLKTKSFNGWKLFWLISIPVSIIMIVAMLRIEIWDGPAVSSMIQLSVRWAIPWLYLAFAASSLQLLFPGAFSRWLLRNRKTLGLCFAMSMAWQLFFIICLVTAYSRYYIDEVYLLRDAIEGLVGYLFLFAMTLTSFNFGRRHLQAKTWRLLHLCGIYFLWAYAFSVYWWNLSYYENPQTIDYIYYWSGFFAFAVRIAAWGRKRQQAASRDEKESSTSLAFRISGIIIIVFGLFISASGLYWQKPVTAFLTTPKWSTDLVLWLPYWPFEPYSSLFIIGLGTMILTRNKA